MRALRHALPVLALVCLAGWYFHRQRSVADLQREIEVLRQRLATAPAARKFGPAEAPPPRGRTTGKPLPGTRQDWRYLARQAALSAEAGENGEPDEEALEAMDARISSMSREELLALLDEIGALGLEPEALAKLENSFIGPLAGKDPELALARFAERIRDDPDDAGSRLAPAIAAWAGKNPAAAAAWLDRQTADGLFEGKSLAGESGLRLEFEAALAGALLATDPDAAARRIGSLPEDQRAEALQGISVSDLSPAARRSYVEMTRSLLPPEDRAGPFGAAFCEMVPDGDFTKSAAFLDSVQATPDERAIAAGWSAVNRLESIAEARPVTRDDIEATRAWLVREAPETADIKLGEALGRASGEGGEEGFSTAAAYAEEMHGRTGSDEVLVNFLENADAAAHPEASRKLAGKISDPARRAEILQALEP